MDGPGLLHFTNVSSCFAKLQMLVGTFNYNSFVSTLDQAESFMIRLGGVAVNWGVGFVIERSRVRFPAGALQGSL